MIVLSASQKKKIAKLLNIHPKNTNLSSNHFINFLNSIYNRHFVNKVIKNVINKVEYNKNNHLFFIRKELAKRTRNSTKKI